MELKIRKAKISDAVKISRLILGTIENINKLNYTKHQMASWRKKYSLDGVKDLIKRKKWFCALENKLLVAVCSINKEVLASFYVKYNKVGKGIGKFLLNYIEDYARKKRMKKLVLYSTKEGHGFYKKMGYKAVRKVKIKVGNSLFPETKMEKKL